jgi:hypothetical protein
MEEATHNKDIFNLLFAELIKTSISVENRMFLKQRITLSSEGNVKTTIIDMSKFMTEPIVFYNSETGADFDEMARLKSDFRQKYPQTLLIKIVSKKLLRLARCSKQLHTLVMNQPFWHRLSQYYDERAFVTPAFHLHYTMGPSEFLKQTFIKADALKDRLMAIVNYRPPPQAPKRRAKKELLAKTNKKKKLTS